MEIKKKLARLKGYMALEDNEGKVEENEQNSDRELMIPHLEEWRLLQAKPFFFDNQYCMIREVTYPLDYKHGNYCIGQLIDICRRWKETEVKHPLSSRDYQVSDLFFFDTETTGLGSGVGNTIFLLGHARVFSDKVIVQQHFLPKPGAEVPLYHSFLSTVDYTTLVTFNGKAFDWPVLKTRHTLLRDLVPNLPEFGHFDLYHAARRIWKHRLESVRLSKIEEEILGVKRCGDVPGFLAPMLYFHFLETERPQDIFGVLKHNEMDVLSLIALYIHLSKQILDTVNGRIESDVYEMGRWFDALGQRDIAKKTYEKVAAKNSVASEIAKWKLSLIYKKERKYEEAVGVWNELRISSSNELKLLANIELAKIYEHRFKQMDKAYECALQSWRVWELQCKMDGTINRKMEQELLKRLRRLERKL